MHTNAVVERRPGRGRCLIAAKNLGLGDSIMTVQPLSAVLDEGQARAHCASCFESIHVNHGGGGGSRCSGCKRIWYCSRKCQKVDWRKHRPECKAWTSQESVRTPTRTLRLAARLLNAMNRSDDGNDGDMGKVNDIGNDDNGNGSKLREAVDDLVHHNDERLPEQKEQYMLMAAFVARLCVAGCGDGKKGSALRWPSAQDRGFPGLIDAAYAVLGKVSCNVFSIAVDASTGEIGCGLYLEAAAANHSCNPNASQSFSGKTLSLRCTRPILLGEEITIGITQIQRPGAARRDSLRTSYFFECRCERCESPGGRAEDARLEAFACPNRKCPGLCLSPSEHRRGVGGSDSISKEAKRPPPPPNESDSQLGEGSHPEEGSVVARGVEGHEGGGVDLSCIHTPLSEIMTGAKAGQEDSACLTCCTCGAISRHVEEAHRERMDIQELLERGKAFETGGQMLSARQCLEHVLGKAVCSLHRGNWMLSEIYSLLASVCLQLQDFEAAAKYASDGMDALRACLSGLRPYFQAWGSSLAFTGKLLLCVRRQPEKALPLLLEAEASIKVTHGDQHSLYREVRDLLDQARADR